MSPGADHHFLELIRGAQATAEKLGYPDPKLRDEYHRHVAQLFAQGYVQLFGAHVDSPDFVPHTGALFPWGVPNHDTVYGFAPIDAEGVYRVSGIKGTETLASLMFRRGGANTGDVHGATLGEIDITQVPATSDGRFSIQLGGSPQEASAQSQSWFAIPHEATGLVSRRVTEECTQRDGVWVIERLDRRPAAVAPPLADSAERMAKLIRFVLRQNEFLIGIPHGLKTRGAVNRFEGEKWRGYGGIAAQSYFQTLFCLEADEVLILESALPQRVGYWSVQLVDPFYGGIDFVSHQSALNRRQVRVDADGRVRFVVADRDPGVPNWLDTGGWREGGVMWRWHQPSELVEPTARTVKLRELRDHLPLDTPRISATERQRLLSARIQHYQSRRRW